MNEFLQGWKRTDYCTNFNTDDVGRDVTVMGWVQTRRDFGALIFIDLRDRTGIMQVVFDESVLEGDFSRVSGLRNEFVIAVQGKIVLRDEETINEKLPTGLIEVKAKQLKILSRAQTPPFEIEDDTAVREELRLKYRYLDLRRPVMQKNILVRSQIAAAAREYLTKNGFIDIETPMLTKSTPEGARDYLVPSRIHSGSFYALPQSPQTLKQILMMSGFDRYFQIVKCFRDEDLRADRQPEFTQIDIEMSFVDVDDIIAANEGLIAHIFKQVLDVDIKLPLKRLSYKDALNRYGSDKPDTRFGLELVDVSDIVADTGFSVFSSVIKKGGSGTDIVTQIEYLKWDSDYSIPGSESDKIVTTDPEGTKSIEYYDVLGRLVKTQAYDGSTCITTGQYTYDTIGNMIKAIDSTGKVSRAYYDVLNRQVRTVIDPFAAGESGHMNAETFIEYDLLGNVKKQTQRAYENETTYTDYAIEYKYDALSRLEKVKQPNPNFGQTGEPEYLETLYYYDKQVSVDGQDLVKNYKADPLGRVSETYFDKLGRKVMDFNKADTSDGDDANGEYMKTQYEYDIRGLVDKVTRTDGTFETYSYDMMGRAELIEYFEAGATESTHSIGYIHDRFGGVKTESVSEGGAAHNTSYAYDKLGRPVSVWQGTYNSSDQPVKESDGLDIAYEYNKAGQLTNIRYKTSATDVQHNLVYVYDDYGRINEIRFDPTAEANNTARKYFYDTHTGILLHTEDYRKFDKNNISDYIKTAYEYNKAGLVEQITYSDAELIDANNPSGITEQYTVQYDGRGYIVGEQHDTDYSTTEGVTSLYKAYQYDSIGRLLKSASGDTLQTGWDNWDKLTQYTYDRVGNRKSMNDGTDSLTYDYNQFDQLTALSKNNEVQTTYEYDLRGNQTKESTKHFDLTVGGETSTYYNTTEYGYNLRNQMISANISTPEADAQTGEVTYNTVDTLNIYNAQGQRIQKTEDGETTKYFYSGSAVFYTTDGGGALTTENILDLGGQIIASKRFPNPDEVGSPFANKYFFYNYDIRGSVTNIVGPDGNLVTGYGYDEFGNQSRSGDGSFLNEVTFTGSVSDTSTGLQYMNARFYQPTTGRFISQDSYTGNAYDPWTQNLYAYCGNNPTNFVDPTGHSALDIVKKISATNKKLAALRKDRAKCVIPPYVSNDVANRIKERAKNLDIMIHSTDIYRRTLYRELADENKKKPAGPIHPAKPKEEPKGDKQSIKDATQALVPILREQGYDYYADQLSGNVNITTDKWGEYKFEDKTFYHKITVLSNSNLYIHGGKPTTGQDLAIKGSYFIPSGGVGETLLVLELICTIIDPDFNLGKVLKPGDVHIYMPVHGETSTYLPYSEVYSAYGTDYYFRGSDLLYYKDQTTHEVGRP